MAAHRFNTVITESGQLLKQLTSASGDMAGTLRASVGQRLAAAANRLARIREASLHQAGAAARDTDEYVHDNPWRVVGIAAALAAVTGLVAGLLIARR